MSLCELVYEKATARRGTISKYSHNELHFRSIPGLKLEIFKPGVDSWRK